MDTLYIIRSRPFGIDVLSFDVLSLARLDQMSYDKLSYIPASNGGACFDTNEANHVYLLSVLA